MKYKCTCNKTARNYVTPSPNNYKKQKKNIFIFLYFSPGLWVVHTHNLLRISAKWTKYFAFYTKCHLASF